MAGTVPLCGGRSSPGTQHPDRRLENPIIRSYRGKCQNHRSQLALESFGHPDPFHRIPRTSRASLHGRPVRHRASVFGRTTGRRPNDGHRGRSARCRPTLCRLPLEQQRTAAGSGSAAGRSVRLGSGTNPAAVPMAANRSQQNVSGWQQIAHFSGGCRFQERISAEGNPGWR